MLRVQNRGDSGQERNITLFLLSLFSFYVEMIANWLETLIDSVFQLIPKLTSTSSKTNFVLEHCV